MGRREKREREKDPSIGNRLGPTKVERCWFPIHVL
jgi:hypothetical protein